MLLVCLYVCLSDDVFVCTLVVSSTVPVGYGHLPWQRSGRGGGGGFSIEVDSTAVGPLSEFIRAVWF